MAISVGLPPLKLISLRDSRRGNSRLKTANIGMIQTMALLGGFKLDDSASNELVAVNHFGRVKAMSSCLHVCMLVCLPASPCSLGLSWVVSLLDGFKFDDSVSNELVAVKLISLRDSHQVSSRLKKNSPFW